MPPCLPWEGHCPPDPGLRAESWAAGTPGAAGGELRPPAPQRASPVGSARALLPQKPPPPPQPVWCSLPQGDPMLTVGPPGCPPTSPPPGASPTRRVGLPTAACGVLRARGWGGSFSPPDVDKNSAQHTLPAGSCPTAQQPHSHTPGGPHGAAGSWESGRSHPPEQQASPTPVSRASPPTARAPVADGQAPRPFPALRGCLREARR